MAALNSSHCLPEEHCMLQAGGTRCKLQFGECVVEKLCALQRQQKSHDCLVQDAAGCCPIDIGLFVEVFAQSFRQPGAGTELLVSLEPFPGAEGPMRLGHARECPCTTWAAAGAIHPAPGKALRLASCLLVLDDRNRLLLTRRQARMRTFGGFWVFPGGRIDPGEEFWETGLREVEEETGLAVDPASLQLLCAWESCFPDVAPGIAHYLIIFFTGRIDPARNPRVCPQSDEYPLRLSEDEIDMAVWLDLEDQSRVLRRLYGPASCPEQATAADCDLSPEAAAAVSMIPSIRQCGDEKQLEAAATTESCLECGHGAAHASVPVEDVIALFNEDSGTGLGRGHAFALQAFWSQLQLQQQQQLDAKPPSKANTDDAG